MIKSLDELEVYNSSMDVGDRVWDIVLGCDHFARDTVGKQWVRAVDSIAANLSEGFGRFYYKENRQFCYYGRGSLCETDTWLDKSYRRRLITAEEYAALKADLTLIGKRLNAYIRSIGKTLPPTTVAEERASYPMPSAQCPVPNAQCPMSHA